MRSLTLTTTLIISFLPSAYTQYTPYSALIIKAHLPPQPPGCQYPSLSDGTYIYFNDPTDSLHYSIYTPWTRFYPDALRADIAQEGFLLSTQRGANASDACGWVTVDTVKKHGWHRGDVSFRHLPSGGVRISKADTKAPLRMVVPFMNHTRRAVPLLTAQGVAPSNATLARIHKILVSNSPKADIIFIMLEIALPIIGVIGFLTLLLLITRHVTNKSYLNPDEDTEQDMELPSLRRNKSTAARVRPRDARTTTMADRYYAAKGVYPPKLFVSKQDQAAPRQSSSVYSRSMDGVTLYAQENTGSWK